MASSLKRPGELWGILRGILRAHPTFTQIKDVVGATGLPVQRLAHLQQKPGGASKGQLIDGIEGLINELDDEGRDQFVGSCLAELLRRYPTLRGEVQTALNRVGWDIGGVEAFLRGQDKYFPPGSHCDIQAFVSQIIKSS